MVDSININDIYDKNLNFLIGSGASFGLFPTLALSIKDDDGNAYTIESLATLLDKDSDRSLHTSLFMHYYKSCIEPVIDFDIHEAKSKDIEKDVIQNYEAFILTILSILKARKKDRKCNLFTTNYDSCLTDVADDILQTGSQEFIVNDGARGFRKRYLHAKNFNSFVSQTGVFERFVTEIPQINLIHLHGSTNWHNEHESIRVSYLMEEAADRKINSDLFEGIEAFSNQLLTSEDSVDQLVKLETSNEDIAKFWIEYNKLPIVNPTKWKFHQTVFEEHYYQMLRMLSYELEKPNSIFITFGFSFADEHIRNLIIRSLTNPSLQVFVCCFNSAEHTKLTALFSKHHNVVCIKVEGDLNFTTFNKTIFNTNQTPIMCQQPSSPTTTATVASPATQTAPAAPLGRNQGDVQ